MQNARQRFLCLIALTATLLLLPGCALVQSFKEDPHHNAADADEESPSVRITFKNAPLVRAIDLYSEFTGRSFRANPSQLDARIDLPRTKKLTRDEANQLLEHIFTRSGNTLFYDVEANAFTLIPSDEGGFYRTRLPDRLRQVQGLAVTPVNAIRYEEEPATLRITEEQARRIFSVEENTLPAGEANERSPSDALREPLETFRGKAAEGEPSPVPAPLISP